MLGSHDGCIRTIILWYVHRFPLLELNSFSCSSHVARMNMCLVYQWEDSCSQALEEQALYVTLNPTAATLQGRCPLCTDVDFRSAFTKLGRKHAWLFGSPKYNAHVRSTRRSYDSFYYREFRARYPVFNLLAERNVKVIALAIKR